MKDLDIRNMEINEQTKGIMTGVVSGAIVGLAMASVGYHMKKKKEREEARKKEMLVEILKNLNGAIMVNSKGEIVNPEEFAYCECDSDDPNLCSCEGECPCHDMDEE